MWIWGGTTEVGSRGGLWQHRAVSPARPESARTQPSRALVRAVGGCALASAWLAAFGLVGWLGDMDRDAGWPARKAVFRWLIGAGLFEHFRAVHVQVLLLAVPLLLGAVACSRAVGVLAGRRGRSTLLAWLVGVALCLPHAALRTVWSADVSFYGTYARQWAAFASNPLVEPANALPPVCSPPSGPLPARPAVCRQEADCPPGWSCGADPFVRGVTWRYHPSPYGPVALAFFRAAYRPGDRPGQTAARLRLVILALWLLAAAVAGWWAGAGAVAWLTWHPLAWMEVANAAHVDALVGVLGLAAVGLAAGHRRTLGGVAAGLAASAKASFAPAGAALLLALGSARAALRYAAGGLAAVALVYAALWGSPHPFAGLLAESHKASTSFVHLVFAALHAATGGDLGALAAARLAGAAAFGAWALWAWRHRPRAGRGALRGVDAARLPAAFAAATALAATASLAPSARPWHLLVPWALAAPIAAHRGRILRALRAAAVSLPLAGYGLSLALYALGTAWVPRSAADLERPVSAWHVAADLVAWLPVALAAWWRLAAPLHRAGDFGTQAGDDAA